MLCAGEGILQTFGTGLQTPSRLGGKASSVGRISVAHPAAMRWMRYAYPPYLLFIS